MYATSLCSVVQWAEAVCHAMPLRRRERCYAMLTPVSLFAPSLRHYCALAFSYAFFFLLSLFAAFASPRFLSPPRCRKVRHAMSITIARRNRLLIIRHYYHAQCRQGVENPAAIQRYAGLFVCAHAVHAYAAAYGLRFSRLRRSAPGSTPYACLRTAVYAIAAMLLLPTRQLLPLWMVNAATPFMLRLFIVYYAVRQVW